MELVDPLQPKDLAAIADAIGVGGVNLVGRIAGGQSATTDILELSNGTGQIVVRRHSDWSAEHDPDVANRESLLVQELGDIGLPVPVILWSGAIAGRPSVVTRLVPGSVNLNPPDQEPWARRLAATLVAIHQVEMSKEGRALLRSAPEGPADTVEPERVRTHRWGEHLLAQRTALSSQRQRADEQRLIHGDYHPGNVLWRGESVSAVLDWEASRLGDRAADVAYCVTELRLLGLDLAATAFVRSYLATTGYPLNSLAYWTATALCRSIGELDKIVFSWGSTRPEHASDVVQKRRDAIIGEVLDLRVG